MIFQMVHLTSLRVPEDGCNSASPHIRAWKNAWTLLPAGSKDGYMPIFVACQTIFAEACIFEQAIKVFPVTFISAHQRCALLSELIIGGAVAVARSLELE